MLVDCGLHPKKAGRLAAPELAAEPLIEIEGGRHPVVEAQVDNFIANDARLNPARQMLLVTGPVPALQVGMVQWEIAERLAAKPGEDAFGSISVLAQSVAKVSIVRKIPPKAFFPAPKVDSAIVRLESDAAARAALEARLAKPEGPKPMERWRNFLRDLYCHRRKNVRGALASLPGQILEKPEIDTRLAAAGIDGNRRAETMGIEEHLRLCEVFG